MPDAYRTPLPCETRTYELTGSTLPPAPQTAFSFDDVAEPRPTAADASTYDDEISYEDRRAHRQTAPPDRARAHALPPRRPGAPGDPLPAAWAQLRVAGAARRELQAGLHAGAARAGLRATAASCHRLPMLRRRPSRRGPLRPQPKATPTGGSRPAASSTHPTRDDTPAQELAYARQHFFLPHRYPRSVPHRAVRPRASSTYDAYDLLVLETRDALGNRSPSASACRRHLTSRQRLPRAAARAGDRPQPQPRRSRLRRARAWWSAPRSWASRARAGRGDSLRRLRRRPDRRPIDPRPSRRTRWPIRTPSCGSATTRLVYDLFAYQRTQRSSPAAARRASTRSPARPTSPICAPASRRKIQHQLLLLRRLRPRDPEEDPGRAGVPACDAHGADGADDVDDRRAGSAAAGRSSTTRASRSASTSRSSAATHRFEFDVQRRRQPGAVLRPGRARRRHAAPQPHLGEGGLRPVAAGRPGTSTTPSLIADPKTDPDVRRLLPRACRTPTTCLAAWHRRSAARAARSGDRSEQARRREDGASTPHTPTVAHADSLGRTFLTVAHNRFKRSDTACRSAVEEFYATRVVLDIEGNQRAVHRRASGPRRHALRLRHARQPHPPGQHGGRRALDAERRGRQAAPRLGQPRPPRSAPPTTPLRRPTEVLSCKRSAARRSMLVGRTVYGESQPNPEAQQPARQDRIKLFDSAGVVTERRLRLQGQPAASGSRQLAHRLQDTRWTGRPRCALEAETFTSRTRLRRAQPPDPVDRTAQRPAGSKRNVIQPDLQRGQPAGAGGRMAQPASRAAALLDPATAAFRRVTTSTTTPRASARASTTATAPAPPTPTTR